MQEQIMNDSRHGVEKPGVDGPDTARICALNDAFRHSFIGGRVVVTAGVGGLADRVRGAVIAGVRAFDGFDPGDDPYGEHDLGALTVEGERICWKIDTYDRSLRLHSPDAADPAVTVRVLTIMLASES